MVRVIISGDTVVPSGTLVEIDEHIYCVDWGMGIGSDRRQPVWPDDSYLRSTGKKIGALLGTHIHLDHVGGFGRVRKYLSEDARVLLSPQSAASLGYVLEDGLKHNAGAFNIFDAVNILKRVEEIPQPGEYTLPTGQKVYILAVGHIPGAYGVIFRLPDGRNALITGDLSRHDQPTVKGLGLLSKELPREWMPDELWGTDLASMLPEGEPLRRSSWKEEVERLAERTLSVLRKGGKVLIGGFATKIPNVAVSLASILAREGFRMFVDGAPRNYLNIYRAQVWSEKDKSFSTKNIYTIQDEEERYRVATSDEPLCIGTTSGTGDFGPIVSYLPLILPVEGNAVYFVSHLFPETRAMKMVEEQRSGKRRPIKIEPEENGGTPLYVAMRAEVDYFGLSSHSYVDPEFIELLTDIKETRGSPLERVIMTHGSWENKSRTAKILHQRNLAKNIVFGERNTVIEIP